MAKGSLRSLDPRARVEEDEVAYATRDLSGKLQAGHPPGTGLRPRGGFTVSFLPSCPGGLRTPFELAFLEEGGATTLVPFTVRVHAVPVVVQGLLSVEDGIVGLLPEERISLLEEMPRTGAILKTIVTGIDTNRHRLLLRPRSP